MKFKIEDKVKIIQRKPGNKSGGQNYNKPNGDVGVVCYVCKYSDEKLVLMENKNNSGKYYGMYCMTEDGYFQDDDLELVEDEFVLPEKWCVKLTKDNVETLEEWRNWKSKSLLQEPIYGYLTHDKIWFSVIPNACKEITFEQFKKYVYMSKTKYECLPFPTDRNYVKLRVVKDILKQDIPIGQKLPDIIPAGSITWALGSSFEDIVSEIGNIFPENNRYSANIPKEYFECIECDSVINTYGLKVGDRLPQDVIRQWTSMGKNRCHINDGVWEKTEGQFVSDRRILSFELINGIVGFEVSGTSGVYLRAAGFKEFMDNFNKPKFEIGKWYKNLGPSRDHIGKFSGWFNEDVISVSEFIYDGELDGPSENFDSSWQNAKLLTDLSEIQQYLPDGHPDKFIKPMERNEFKKGDYIVCLVNGDEWNNICFKQRKLHYYLAPELDLEGSRTNAWRKVSIDTSYYRYATPEEIAEYDRLGKPYDVTTLEKSPIPSNLQFYVKYSDEFTEDLYNKLNEWCKNNTKGKIRGYADSFEGFKNNGFYVFNNWGLLECTSENYHNKIKDRLSYGVDNNPQGCKKEFSIVDVKLLIDYKNEKMDDLIEEVKRRYPVGTKFFPAHVNNNHENYCVITEDCKFVREGHEIYSDITSSKQGLYGEGRWVDPEKLPQYGNTSCNRCVYDNGKWAEILKEEPKSEEWEPKVGDWVYILNNGCHISGGLAKGLKGLIGQLKPSDLNNYHYSFMINDTKIGFNADEVEKYLRKAEPHEIPKIIPKNEDLPMAKPYEYTAEEALAELKRRGFRKGVEYFYMDQYGVYNYNKICKATREPGIRSDYFIDCGEGYLWVKTNPSLLHKGPISAPTNNDYPLTLNEVFSSEQFNKPNYLKPETLLPKTILNY